MIIEWGTMIFTALVSLLSAGGIGWIFTARQDRKAKELDNKAKEYDLEEHKKDEIIQDWKDLASERKARADELAATLKERDAIITKKDALIADLRAKLDEKNTYCAVAELMRCETVSCPERKPPFGMRETKVVDNFEN